ncbi:LVIVD repeat-containing protein [Ornithinimicrobium faecis]|uniref:LVIVD repeat-containing protein n=1 Tax=Ornithinimicrobium faecis TaxID=2934158 RepID=A0ABY4YWN4_9MICO|nr:MULTISPECIES: hypothetical protein [unclassified Ornithinimicrobium]USQ80944.1 hypothetical protein NF556_04650 [Ornithinimicrobium sp. HY1793]
MFTKGMTRGLQAAALAVALVGGPAIAAVAADSGTDLEVDEVATSDNVEHTAHVPPQGAFADSFGTDMAFQGDLAFVGNYNGFIVYDISDPESPQTVSQVLCPGGQADVTVHGDLLFLSVDSSRSDDSCQSESLSATNKEAWEGMRVFDVSDPANPQYVAAVETNCGSHTHTLVPAKNGKNVYLYVSSYGPRDAYPDCQPPHDLISIIDVPVDNPEAAAVVATPNLFAEDGGGYTNTSGCHDITAFPQRNIAAGACMGDGIILDIAKPLEPKVVERVRDTENFAFWHSATFNQQAKKVVFTDELGGGGAATCNEAIGPNRGANAIYDLRGRSLDFQSYYKIDRHQFDTENCVAHNGSLIPVNGKDLMVQAWYQGGVSVWDFTDSSNPQEIGFFERGPISDSELILGGSWSAYYYNGHIYSSDITKGFDVLTISDPLTDPAADVQMDELNVQTQPMYRGGN